MANQNPPAKRITTRRELESHIVAKAWRDSKYRKRLLKDPKAILRQELQAIDANAGLPDDLRIAVHEEAALQMHIVLPRNPREIMLSEVVGDNLEQFAPQTAAVAVAVVALNMTNVIGVANVVGNGNIVSAIVSATATGTAIS